MTFFIIYHKQTYVLVHQNMQTFILEICIVTFKAKWFTSLAGKNISFSKDHFWHCNIHYKNLQKLRLLVLLMQKSYPKYKKKLLVQTLIHLYYKSHNLLHYYLLISFFYFYKSTMRNFICIL